MHTYEVHQEKCLETSDVTMTVRTIRHFSPVPSHTGGITTDASLLLLYKMGIISETLSQKLIASVKSQRGRHHIHAACEKTATSKFNDMIGRGDTPLLLLASSTNTGQLVLLARYH